MQINRFGYYWLDTWVLANVIQLATQDFCARNYSIPKTIISRSKNKKKRNNLLH